MPKFQIRAPRFIDGALVRASHQFPAVIEVAESQLKRDDKGRLLDNGLIPLDDPRARAVVSPHFVPQKVAVPTAAEVLAAPAETEPASKPGKGGKRAADTDVA